MTKIISKNRKAYFDYEVIDEYVAGIVLVGTEVKSIKSNKVSLLGSFCFIENNEIFIKSMDISVNKETSHTLNHNPTRERKLLMKKKEIVKLHESITQKGLTVVPLEIFLTDSGFIKIKIGLVKGKKLYDKRESLKAKDLDRDLQRNK